MLNSPNIFARRRNTQVIYIPVRIETNKNDWEVSAKGSYIRTKFGYNTKLE